MEMKLSHVYRNASRWMLVHSTSYQNLKEVEFVTEQFFFSAGEAWKWYHQHHKLEDFILVQAVEVEGLQNLTLKD